MSDAAFLSAPKFSPLRILDTEEIAARLRASSGKPVTERQVWIRACARKIGVSSGEARFVRADHIATLLRPHWQPEREPMLERDPLAMLSVTDMADRIFQSSGINVCQRLRTEALQLKVINNLASYEFIHVDDVELLFKPALPKISNTPWRSDLKLVSIGATVRKVFDLTGTHVDYWDVVPAAAHAGVLRGLGGFMFVHRDDCDHVCQRLGLEPNYARLYQMRYDHGASNHSPKIKMLRAVAAA